MITLDASVWIAALDKKDPRYVESVQFLGHVVSRSVSLFAPSFALVEVACALARRTGSADFGKRAMEKVRTWPQLAILSAEVYIPEASIEEGVRVFLRAGDATYAATSRLTESLIISWDVELNDRACGMTPADWLAGQV